MSQAHNEILDAAHDRHTTGRLLEAAELYRKALQLRPDDDQCLFFLGLVMFQVRRLPVAVDLVRRAIVIDPDVAEYHCDLGRILFALNDLAGAISASRKALELRPDFPEALFNLGNALCRSGLLEEGIDAYQRAIALRGDAPDAVNNVGMALLTLGRIDEAVACFDRILILNPTDAAAHSNRIYAVHFNPSWSAMEIRRELIQWNQRHAQPLKATIVPHANDRDLDRPLRTGTFRRTSASMSWAGICCPCCKSTIQANFTSSAMLALATPMPSLENCNPTPWLGGTLPISLMSERQK